MALTTQVLHAFTQVISQHQRYSKFEPDNSSAVKAFVNIEMSPDIGMSPGEAKKSFRLGPVTYPI